MLPQVKECLLATKRWKPQFSSESSQMKDGPANTFIWNLVSETVREYISVVLSSQACDNLSQQPEKLIPQGFHLSK